MTYGEDGEVCFSCPTMMAGYYNLEDENEAITFYKDGIKYYRTGDRGHIREDGTLYIFGRVEPEATNNIAR